MLSRYMHLIVSNGSWCILTYLDALPSFSPLVFEKIATLMRVLKFPCWNLELVLWTLMDLRKRNLFSCRQSLQVKEVELLGRKHDEKLKCKIWLTLEESACFPLRWKNTAAFMSSCYSSTECFCSSRHQAIGHGTEPASVSTWASMTSLQSWVLYFSSDLIELILSHGVS
jgi:hypothetical protein